MTAKLDGRDKTSKNLALYVADFEDNSIEESVHGYLDMVLYFHFDTFFLSTRKPLPFLFSNNSGDRSLANIPSPKTKSPPQNFREDK